MANDRCPNCRHSLASKWHKVHCLGWTSKQWKATHRSHRSAGTSANKRRAASDVLNCSYSWSNGIVALGDGDRKAQEEDR